MCHPQQPLVPLRSAVCFLLAAVAFLGACAGRETAKGRPNVLLLVVDTLRADHLGMLEEGVELTPNLDRFVERAVVFRDAIAQGSNTINSTPSILASAYLKEHGYTNYKLAIAPEHRTLAEVLQQAGFATFAVSANPHVGVRNGLGQGFDTFLDNPSWSDTDAHELNRLFLDWLAERRGDERPFFAMLWYVDPHVPYDPPREYIEEQVPAELRSLVSMKTKRPGFQDLSEAEKSVTRGLYRGEVSYVDDQLADLLDELESRGTFDNTLIILTSDHGESFWEKNGVDGKPVVGHGISLFEEEVAVPLIIKMPDSELTGTVEERVQSVDIAPTVLDIVEVAAPEGRERYRGASMVGLMTGTKQGSWDRPAFSDLATDPRGTVTMNMESVETDSGKLIRTQIYRRTVYDPPVEMLFDSEGRPIVIEDPESRQLRDSLLSHLRRRNLSLRRIPAVQAHHGSRRDKLEDRLKALGYMN